MKYTLRKVYQEDFLSLLAVEQDAFLGDGYSPYFLKMIPYLFPDTCFVAVVDGQVVGYSLGAPDGHDRKSGWILTVAVKHGHQGLGIGKALTFTLMDAMTERGMTTLFLTVEPSNPAKVLYEKYGFRDIRFEQDCYGEGKDRYYMERKVEK